MGLGPFSVSGGGGGSGGGVETLIYVLIGASIVALALLSFLAALVVAAFLLGPMAISRFGSQRRSGPFGRRIDYLLLAAALPAFAIAYAIYPRPPWSVEVTGPPSDREVRYFWQAYFAAILYSLAAGFLLARPLLWLYSHRSVLVRAFPSRRLAKIWFVASTIGVVYIAASLIAMEVYGYGAEPGILRYYSLSDGTFVAVTMFSVVGFLCAPIWWYHASRKSA